ncbi:MAG: hypothetical protein KAH23_00800 [Kiritimatiellae bacterium]|nr:hypothetical protein [Kiritimatiellia bacterium]
MSKLRVCSLVTVSLLCAVIFAGCVTSPAQVSSFKIKSQKTTKVYGPFVYANEADVVTGPSKFVLLVDEELAKTCSFKIKSAQTGRTYGPFRCKLGEDIVIGVSIFSIVNIY